MTETMTYKKRAVVRKDNVIWYGSNAQPFVVMLQLNDTKQEYGISVAGSVRCFLMRTDTNDPMKKVVKQTMQNSLYDAMELAACWLKERGI